MNNVLMEFSVVCLTFGLLFVLPCVLLSEMENQEEQRVALKFLQKSGSTPIQCWHSLSQVFGTQTMSKTQVRVWCRCFSAGETSVKVKPKTGRPRTQRTEENKDKVDQLVHQDGRRSVRNLADQTGIKKDVVWKILSKDLNRKKKSVHFVPHLLTQEQKDFRKKLCEENLALIHQDHREMLSEIVTGDETWISTFEPETKRMSSAWVEVGELPPQKAVRQHAQTKTMCTVFFDFQGVIYCEFLEKNATIDSDCYIQTLCRLKEQIRRKRPFLWQKDPEGNRSFLLHQDNVPVHTSVLTLAKFGEWGINLLAHPPYSLDLAPCDFHLFPKLKEQLRGRRFRNVEAVQAETRRILAAFPADFYEQAIADLVTRWKKCCAVDGDYFEGRHINVDPEEVSSSEESSDDD